MNSLEIESKDVKVTPSSNKGWVTVEVEVADDDLQSMLSGIETEDIVAAVGEEEILSKISEENIREYLGLEDE